jgi:NADH:ubiquinone oxidoreductase subunit 3 (subunit A)
MGRFVRPSKATPEKRATYESGSEPVDGNWSQTRIRYYLFALLFVVFDVETVFIVPWAVQVDAFGTYGLVEMAVFIAVLALGLAYAWRKGVFEWDS